MATSPNYIDSILEKLPTLATLVLEPLPPEAAGAAEAATLRQLLVGLEQAGVDAGLRGIPYLFRMLYKLPMRWPLGDIGEADQDSFNDWIAGLYDHLQGRSDTDGAGQLLGHLCRLSWMPRLEPRLTEILLKTLGDDAAALRQRAQTATLPPLPADTDGNAFTADEGATADGAGTFAAADTNDTNDTNEEDGAAPDTARPLLGEDEIPLPASLPASQPGSAAAVPAAVTAGAPWVSAEELTLVADAVATQWLPAAAAAAEALAAPGQGAGEAIDACAEQLQLIQAALEALELQGLRQLGDGYAALLARLNAAGDAADPADVQTLGLWPVLLLCHLQDPINGDIARDLTAQLAERGLLPPASVDATAHALVQLRIGVDPALRAQRKRSVGDDDVALDIAADVLPAVLNGMLSELPRRAAEFSQHLQTYLRSRQPADLAAARRIAHTLKGDGNIVGLRGIANLTHALEEIFDVLAVQPERVDSRMDELLIDAADMLEAMSDRVLGRGPEPAEAVELLQRVIDCANALLDDGSAESLLPQADDTLAAEADNAATGAATQSPGTSTAATAATSDAPALVTAASLNAAAPDDADAQTITIPMRLLDELLRQTGEAVIYARQVENRVERVERRHGEITNQGQAFQTLIAELQQLVEVRGAALSALRLNLGEEFDDLEMDRYNELHTVTLRLVEASADARASAGELNEDVVALRELLSQQDRVHLDLRDRVQRARTVPLQGLLPRLQRVVRQTARQVGKPCELQIDGEDTLLDKELLDGLAEPLLHLLRNAIDHGIETPDQRAAAGKPTAGRIVLGFGREAGQVVIECRDDGAGLDLERIRGHGLERGLIASGRDHSDAELAELVFHTGFSTRTEATLTSGRGLGMEIVRRRITALKGDVTLRSERGQGCTVELRLPSSQIAAHVLLAQAGAERVAINLSGVQQLALYEPGQLRRDGEQLLLQLSDDEPYRAVHLAQLLGFALPAEQSGRHALLLAGRERIAVLVETLGDARSVIVKNLGPHVAPAPGVLGATILGDGAVATVVDLPQLAARLSRHELPLPGAGNSARAEELPSVLIVDDSLSVRRSLEQVIGDAGFRVASARDGLEAVAQVRERQPDLLVIDLEMPRMNGLELTSFIRKDEATRHIPIIMITSRTTERHRELARSAGVDTVLSKPYSEEGLLALIVDKLTRGRLAA